MPIHLKARAVALLIALLIPFAPHASAEKTQPTPNLLKNTAELTSLDSLGVKPWHMRLDITLFDKEGKNPQSATVEIWSANGNRKVVESLSGATVTDLNLAGKLLRAGSNDPVFFGLDSLLDHIIHPVPLEVLSPPVTSTEEKTKLGALKLECLLPQLVPPSVAALSNEPLSYCMDAGTDNLRVTFAPGHIALARPRLGTFLSKQVPVELQVLSGSTVRDDVKITQLATYEPSDADFNPAADMQPVSTPIDSKGAELLGEKLWSGNPIYPVEARKRHTTGTVVFNAVISPDGHIASLEVKGNADLLLQAAATDSVKLWIYRPLRMAGVPVAFKTEITVHFNMSF